MNILKLKINSYGKLKNKEINLNKGINLIYGKNEAGKSTLINYIVSSFYGISKNKNGKEISDYEKYKPWAGEDFSGDLEYKLDNGEKYEIYRDFNKKNPKIFNSNMEDISKNFNIDKNKGNEFFYEQTKIDEDLFLSTLAINQDEVKLEDKEQNFLIQKIANLAQTGNDKTSFKRVIDRINRRQLDEIGTERSREKPINVTYRNLQELQDEKENLQKYKNFKYEYQEKENDLNDEILNLENENNYLKEIKLKTENEKIENEKIKLKENIKKENNEKINLINNKINEIKINNKKILENNFDNNFNYEKNIENKSNKNNKKYLNNKNKSKKIKKINLIFILIILINILQFIFIKNNYFKYIFLLTVPVYLIFYIYFINKEKLNQKKSQKIEENKLNEINLELINLENEKKLIENNQKNNEEELNNLKNNLIQKNNYENEKIKNKYLNKIEKNKLNNFINFENLEKINLEIENTQNKINNKKIELHTLNLDKQNIEPKLDNLSKIEEEIAENNEKLQNLQELNMSMNLAKDVLNDAYEKMKNSVTPKFTENLSHNISNITNMKYNKVMFNEEEGLIVSLENGDNIPANRFSIGTIDQLYLSLRLSMADELSEEKVPILLDEAFAYYDNERLKNILQFLNDNFKNRQVIIFSCTNREKEILNNLNINYNFVEL